MDRIKLWFRCDTAPHAYKTNILDKVIIRCYCGYHIRPRLVPLEKP